MIILTTLHEEKKKGTKTVWIEMEQTTEEIDKAHYDNIVKSAPFFRNLGGSETITKEYTCAGYIPTHIISTSPDKQTRTIRHFIFK